MCMVIFYISHVHFFWIFFFFFITTYRYVCAKQFTELRTGLWWETDKTSAWFVCVWRSATSPDERLKMVGIRGVHTHTHKQRHSTHSTPTSNLLKCVWFLSCKERHGARSWLGRLSVPDAVHTVWFDRSDMSQVLFLELVLEIENKQQSIWILTLASLRQVSLSWILWPKTTGFICTESCVQIIYINGCLLSNKEQIWK